MVYMNFAEWFKTMCNFFFSVKLKKHTQDLVNYFWDYKALTYKLETRQVQRDWH